MATRLVILLDKAPWRSSYSDRSYVPIEPGEPIGRVRDLPIAEIEPVVYLADGTPHVLRWGWETGLAGIHDSGRDRRTRPGQMHARLRPRLITLAHLKREVDPSRLAGLTIVEVDR